jgi:hypothetical protein
MLNEKNVNFMDLIQEWWNEGNKVDRQRPRKPPSPPLGKKPPESSPPKGEGESKPNHETKPRPAF